MPRKGHVGMRVAGRAGRGIRMLSLAAKRSSACRGFSTKLEIWACGLLVKGWAQAWVSRVRLCTDLSGGADAHPWASSVMGFWVGGGSCGRPREARCGS